MSDTEKQEKGPQQLALEAEFPAAMLGSVRKGGTSLTYIPVHEVIQRLNDVLGVSGWDWETTRVWRDETDPDWILATGVMVATIDGVQARKSGEGGVKLKRTTTGKEIVDLGDEFKGAASDALKKAAQKNGVGLYLSRKDEAKRYEAPVDVVDPTEEGWETAEECKTLTDALSRAIKAIGGDFQQRMRRERERLGVIPGSVMPRKAYDELKAIYDEHVEAMKSRLDGEAAEKPVDATKGEPAPDAAATPQSTPTGLAWHDDREMVQAHNELAEKVEALSDELQDKIGTWRTEQGLVETPLSRTDYLRLEAFVDAVAGAQQTLA